MSALIHLAGEVAHELNNIFTAVTGNLSLLSEHIGPQGMPIEMIREISRTAERGVALSQKLQAFAGRQPLTRKPVDVSHVLLDCVAELEQTVPDSVQLSLTKIMPGCISFLDGDKLRSTLKELAQNAVVAMQGQGSLFFEVITQSIATDNKLDLRPGLYVRVRVVDTGPGMAPEVAARAMDPMFSTRRTHINAGWGLSNGAGFLRQSGGCMHLCSATGSGTAVELYLPLHISVMRGASRPAGMQAVG